MISFVESFVELFSPKVKAEPKKYKIRNRVSKNLGSLDLRPKVTTFQSQYEDEILKIRTKANKINEKLDSIDTEGITTDETGIKLKIEVSPTKLAGVLGASAIRIDGLEKELYSSHEKIADLKNSIIAENNEFEKREAELNITLEGLKSDKLSSTLKDHRLKAENNGLKNQALKVRMELDDVMAKIKLLQQRTTMLDEEISILQEAIANFNIQD
jgi:chromosome segregation ATPase